MDRSAEFQVAVEGTMRNLHPILRDEVYRIAGQAPRKWFHHAQAQRIEMEIPYDERQLRLRVRDDGVGIDRKFLSEEGRPGHFGLHGMRERARLAGGKPTVWSAGGAAPMCPTSPISPLKRSKLQPVWGRSGRPAKRQPSPQGLERRYA